ncbi:fumarylacetoacetate hydrolase family protein [Paenibacillus sediminis]|uniref:2-oxo-3-hexenedioate decarboxylase n=1 Tax=Paenibacillus sediminis TaxID=664909 RepID=A0ABS4GZC8_9BACL|nr:fumarylacetoacetate hydrolase family protein [Paenibacillus sediminis]MBP1935245.1 2-oxo-3-hexenedioate decarboxylase [Paenibacillus sediminis]
MDTATVKKIAKYLHLAELEKREVPRITLQYPELSVEEAYEIQEHLVQIKLEHGHNIVGPKMGLTSQAKMKQMGVDEPIYGYVFDHMVKSGQEISLSDYIHPKVEAEIAFILGKDLEGTNVTIHQVLDATEYITPALEIIDSRYENFNFTLPDVIADNASSSGVLFGTLLQPPHKLELDLIGVTLLINGHTRDLGAGAAVLGHPAKSVAMLANMLGRRGLKLKAGQVILTGGITGAIQFEAKDTVSAKFAGIGSVDFVVKE